MEAANATVVHARLALEAVDAEFAEALVSAHNAKTKETFAEDGGDLGKDFNMEDDEEIDSDEADGIDEDEEIDSDEAEGDGDDDDEPAPPKNNKARAKQSPRRRTIARTPVEVVELLKIVGLAFTTRGGIDPRRRTTPRRRRRRQRVAVKRAASAQAPSGGGGNKKTAKTASDANHEIWYEKTSGAKASKARAPAKKAASRASAASAAPGSMPSWRRNAPPRASPSVVRSPVQPPGPPSDNTS